MDEEVVGTKKSTLCEVCREKPAKYTCPGCNTRTCSLDCVRKHKIDTKCKGVRNRTKFVSMADFNDETLHDDYFFLSDIARVVDSSAKSISELSSWKVPRMVEMTTQQKKTDFTNSVGALVTKAKERKVNLIIMPHGMTRQKENRSRYNFTQGVIMWHSKWILSSINPPLSFTTQSSELSIVGDVMMQGIGNIDKHLFPLVARYLQNGLDGIVILLEKYAVYNEQEEKHSSVKEYYIVPAARSFRDILAGIDILEYPIFHVIFTPDLCNYKVINLPLEPLEPWTPPVKKEKRERPPEGEEVDDKKFKETEPNSL